jgi:Outer membrane protein beta-barrel domain
MFRKLFATIVTGVIVSTGPLTAQAGLGVVGGYVSSTVSVDPATAGITWAGRSGFAGGVSFSVRVASGASIGLEGLYVQKGADVHIGTASGSEKLTYFEVPILLQLALGNARKPHLFVTAGAQYSVLNTCSQVSAGIADVDCKMSATATTGIRSSDYGVMFGGGAASGRYSLSVRYDLGLANLNKDTSAGQEVAKNRAIMALVSIRL